MEQYDRKSLSDYEELTPVNESHGVFLVRDRSTGRLFIKKIMERYNKDVYQRVKRESIKGIPKIYEISEEDSRLTLIEEYINGDDLETIINKEGSLSDDKVKTVISSLCDILSALHDMVPPVIHRDIKPSNVMISSEGNVYLIDLNAAKQEDTLKEEDTVLLGTYGYAAPEQYGFGSSRTQTDIYAVGMLMNTMLKGEYSKEIAGDSIYAGVIRKCLMLDPDERYASVKELKKALMHPRRDPGRNENLPPGFRTGNPMHMFTAAVGYGVIFALCLNLNTKNQSSEFIMWYERIGCLLLFLILVFFMADYKNIQKGFVLSRSENLLIRIIGVIIWSALFAVVLLFAIVAGELILIGLMQ
ncbi:MAG: serine/threonine protein kinase [Lachnospiraceae bacterium]|nr:serine/threonine protein kinase [Lachnospiraceae bacterium]